MYRYEEKKISHPRAILAIALAAGVLAGAYYGYSTRWADGGKAYDRAQLVAGLEYDAVRAGKEQCVVLQDRTELRSEPSALEGSVLNHLSAGERVVYLATASSMDTASNMGVVTADVHIYRLINAYDIPAGTKVSVIGYNERDGRYAIRVNIGDKERGCNVDKSVLQLGYTGQWKQVRYNEQEGWVRYSDLTQPEVL